MWSRVLPHPVVDNRRDRVVLDHVPRGHDAQHRGLGAADWRVRQVAHGGEQRVEVADVDVGWQALDEQQRQRRAVCAAMRSRACAVTRSSFAAYALSASATWRCAASRAASTAS